MSEARVLERWKHEARKLKANVYALYFAFRDPRVPWYAKVFIACVLGYAFSPIGLGLLMRPRLRPLAGRLGSLGPAVRAKSPGRPLRLPMRAADDILAPEDIPSKPVEGC